jgi:hypothetical protein
LVSGATRAPLFGGEEAIATVGKIAAKSINVMASLNPIITISLVG